MSERSEPWLVAIDIDGTLISDYGTLNPGTTTEVRRLVDAGHYVTIATGRSVPMTLPFIDQLGIEPEFVVCANGAIIVRRDESHPTRYARDTVELFDPGLVLREIYNTIPDAHYAVEDETGLLRYIGWFPETGVNMHTQKMETFEELLTDHATRVVVIAPTSRQDYFTDVVDMLGLHKVTYSIGYTSWLDIGPQGVNKATALEKVRERWGIPRNRVMAIGDGRNDIDMLEWAGEFGRGIAMGQAPEEVRDAASELTLEESEGGLPSSLATLD
jgi:Cof subfamily protein (haloacid dehalogenase superfamily)